MASENFGADELPKGIESRTKRKKHVGGPHDLLLLQILRVLPPYRAGVHGFTVAEILGMLPPLDGTPASKIRRVQRAIQNLEAEYLHIEMSGNRKLIWLSEIGRRLNPGKLDRKESLLLALAFKQLGAMLPNSLKTSLLDLQVKANATLMANVVETNEVEWLKKIYSANSTQPLIPAENKPGVLDAVSDALYENRYLRVVYTNKMRVTREGDVRPLGLVQQGNKMLMVCECDQWDADEISQGQQQETPIKWNLMLHRIDKATPLDQTFNRPDDFSLETYDRRGGFGIGTGRTVKMRFKMTAQNALSLLETKLSEDQTHVQLADDWYQIQATLADTLILDRWLAGFGVQVKDVEKLPCASD